MNLFDVCEPKDDVLGGNFVDDQFAADLSKVIDGTAPRDYKDPQIFFQNTYPTLGIQSILLNVSRRLAGSNNQSASLFRLDTQFGGGKTHSLIALYHAMNSRDQIPNIKEFIPASELPTQPVKIVSLTGEASNPADGMIVDTDDLSIRPRSIWGELAYKLGGKEAYNLLQESDRSHSSPGSSILAKILPRDKPVLILIDEIAVYLRKAENAHRDASKQFASFLQELGKEVTTSGNICLVLTLAINQDQKAMDAYQDEQLAVVKAFEEMNSVVGRQATILNPTGEEDTKNVIRRRLFQKVDKAKVKEIISRYKDVWTKNISELPSNFNANEYSEKLASSYPFHPMLLEALTEKLSSLDRFQRTRGMLRLLARTVHELWEAKPKDTFCIHTHHIPLGLDTVRDELTSRLDQSNYTPCLKADVTAVKNENPSTAQSLDQSEFPGEAPLVEYTARTIFINSLAYPDNARGISEPDLKFSVLYPGLDGGILNRARTKFIENSQYLDDRPDSPLRFLANPNLEQVIRRHMRDFDHVNVFNLYNETIRDIFSRGNLFRTIYEPQGAHSVADDGAEGVPYLVVFNPSQLTVESDQASLPDNIEKIFTTKGTDGTPRIFKNNLLFLACAQDKVSNIEEKTRRMLALDRLNRESSDYQFPEHQQLKIKEQRQTAQFDLATAIADGYRHLYYPSHNKNHTFTAQLRHIVIDKFSSANRPGDGQISIRQALKNEGKIQEEGSPGDSPNFVQQKVMGGRDSITTQGLKSEFKKSPNLSMLYSNSPLLAMIRKGIEDGVFIYKLGDQVWGQGDPLPNIQISEESEIYKRTSAEDKKLWPRPEPLEIHLRLKDIRELGVYPILISVSGGIPPYTYSSDSLEEYKNFGPTTQTSGTCNVRPTEASNYILTVTDSQGKSQQASLYVDPNKQVSTPQQPQTPFVTNIPPSPKIQKYDAEGPLKLALEDLWKKVRANAVGKIQRIRIRVYDKDSVSKIQQGSTSLQNTKVEVEYNGSISTPAVSEFSVNYIGELSKFSSIRTFFEAQIRALGGENNVNSAFLYEFNEGLDMSSQDPENFANSLVSYGGADVFVEAEVQD